MTQIQQAALATLEACVTAISSAVADLRASISDPPPPPPPPSVEYELLSVSVNRSAVVCGAHWHGLINGPSYNRFPKPEVITPSDPRTYVATSDMNAHVWRTFGSREYTLLYDGNPLRSFNTPEGLHLVAVTLDLAGIEPGWHLLSVDGLSEGESCIPWYVLILNGPLSDAAKSVMPIMTANHQFLRSQSSTYWHGMVPSGFHPTPMPLAPIACDPIPTLQSQSQLQRTHLAPHVPDWDRYRPTRHASGAWHCINDQSYNIPQLMQRGDLRGDALDGPRNVGTISMPTHIQIGAVDPEGLRAQRYYVLEPGRFCRVDLDGTITTLVGHCRTVPGGPMELRGDWSAVPTDRRFLWEAWGACWTPDTAFIDPNSDPIQSEGGLRPHIHAPTMLIADTRNNRILKVEWSATQHAPAGKVTELVTDIAEPWDIVPDPADVNCFVVSERGAHRVTRRKWTTGELIETLLQGAPLAYVREDRKVQNVGTLDQIRAEKTVCPEGLFVMDDWIYIGSWAQQQVRRLNRTTGALETVQQVAGDDNSHFVKCAVSDGTFGERGRVFSCTWSSLAAGHPIGVPGNFGNSYVGPGLPWRTHGYASAVAVGQGRLLFGSSSEGLTIIHAADPGQNAVTTADAGAMLTEWCESGMHLLHGFGGYGHLGLPLPWGHSEAIDKYLTLMGHVRE